MPNVIDMKKDATDNFATALVHYACPICGKDMDESLIMNQKLTEKFAKGVRGMNGKCLGYSPNACDECYDRAKDKGFYLIAIDPAKSEGAKCLEEIYCTGKLVCVDKHSPFIEAMKHDKPQVVLKTENNIEFALIEDRYFDEIVPKNPNENN